MREFCIVHKLRQFTEVNMASVKQGYVITANSQINNKPLYMVVYGFRSFNNNRKLSSNGKTPGMVQIAYIPANFLDSGAFVSKERKDNVTTCGMCELKDDCYVENTTLAVVVKQLQKLVSGDNSNYEWYANVDANEKKQLALILQLTGLRLGMYGNPSSVDFKLNEEWIKLVHNGKQFIAPYTAYDHHVLYNLHATKFEVYKDWVMASISAPKDWGNTNHSKEYWLNNPYSSWELVKASGMSSYCVLHKHQPTFSEQRIHCPFVLDDLLSKGCSECKLCSGTKQGKRIIHVVDFYHGKRSKAKAK